MSDSTAAATPHFGTSPLAHDLRAFAGDNADTLVAKMRGWLPPGDDPENAARQRRHRGGIASIVWPALLLGFVWMLFRKMYIEGAVFAALPVLIVVLLPGVTGLMVLPFILAAALGGWLYCKHARRAIARADAQALDGEARSAFLAQAGGTSTGGAILGAIVYVVIAGGAVYAVTQGLPAG